MEPAFESWSAAMQAQQAYLESLPQWVQLWMNWMTFAFLSSVWFVFRRAEARWVLLVGIATGVAASVFGYYFGWNRLWGLVHIVLWTPLLVYLVRRRVPLGDGTGYAVWSNLLIATIAISLAFDVVDVIRYMAGSG